MELKISCSYGPGRYDHSYEEEGHDYPYGYVRWTENRNMAAIVRLMASKAILVEPLITHTFNIDNAEKHMILSQAKHMNNILGSFFSTMIRKSNLAKR